MIEKLVRQDGGGFVSDKRGDGSAEWGGVLNLLILVFLYLKGTFTEGGFH
jgi:hypothetical protein